MNKQAVGKFLNIRVERMFGSLDKEPVQFKAGELLLCDVIYAGDNDYDTLMEMLTLKPEGASRKLFICKDTKMSKSRLQLKSKGFAFDDSLYLTLDSPKFNHILAGRKEFTIMSKLNPIVVVYKNKNAVSVLKEVGPPINKINDEEMPQHFWRKSIDNGYVFSMNLKDEKAKFEVAKVFMLSNPKGEFTEITKKSIDQVRGGSVPESIMSQADFAGHVSRLLKTIYN